MTELKVGHPAPFNFPTREGCMMEIGYPVDGLNVMLQYPNLSEKELQVFNMPLEAYSYHETETIVPIAYWVFKFSQDLYVETTFDAKVAEYDSTYMGVVRDYMKVVDDRLSTRILFIILDRKIIKAIRVLGLHQEAVGIFHRTINQQLEMDYSHEDFILTVKQLEGALSSAEIFSMGKVFKFGE